MNSRSFFAIALCVFTACSSRVEPDASSDARDVTPDGAFDARSLDGAVPGADATNDGSEQPSDARPIDVPTGRDGSDVSPVLTPPPPGYCRDNLDCMPGFHCSPRDGACLQCMQDAECPLGEQCVGNSCVGSCADSGTCPAGQTCCGGSCVDTQTNPENCGACANRCATNRCIEGACIVPCTGLCGDGLTCCASVCRDLQHDNFACGRCWNGCEGTQTCVDGRCQDTVCSPPCARGESCCGSTCANLQTDALHCGACGYACPVGNACIDGQCTPTRCASGPACASGSRCCWGACIDVTNDPSNCGDCGTVCSAGAMCIAGICRTPLPPGSDYDHSVSDQPFIDACAATGGATVLPSTDDATTRIGLPFPFTLWGHPVANPWINSNGVLEFTTLPSSSAANVCVDGGSATNQSIFAFWDDLRTRSGICIATVGDPGSRSFVVEWNDATFASSANAHLTFEIVLHEGSNLIDLVYATMTGDPSDPTRATGTSASIGTKGGISLSESIGCNAAVITAPIAYRLTPL